MDSPEDRLYGVEAELREMLTTGEFVPPTLEQTRAILDLLEHTRNDLLDAIEAGRGA